ncbi:platelet-activating factor acetylhydrolase IB subunit alpha2-like [Petromyzon marinus]|uniref:1-alkyl-2-acetylglycerophosphocholine esterase n=2 Tax=Petromyzon marinus TaxID=7757 RepID=A0AAJ7UG62_PETMA|nr:platelet-activating factor acetylhydrolase IB subunit beta-like [Petromyzon marinus]XP_032835696.1 platelet-activating factor acetylhydrolase IB subunit beta-like [Petromyzon marinus]
MEQCPGAKATDPQPITDTQGDRRWMSIHESYVIECKSKEPEILFVGDSMVQLLGQYEIWKRLFSPLHALNFGIGGDETQHVLWRLQNGELENIDPKVIVVWVGTNNHKHTPEEISEGILAIVTYINEKHPQAAVVVLGLLPRGRDPNPLREKNLRVNELVAKALVPANDVKPPRAHFLDDNYGFVHSDGTIGRSDMYDFLHLTTGGYENLCGRLHELILNLLGETNVAAKTQGEPSA